MPDALLPDPVVRAVGRVAVNGALLERDVVKLLLIILNEGRFPERNEHGALLIPDSFGRAHRELGKWARQRIKGGLRPDIVKWLEAAKRAQERRHVIVHGAWVAGPDPLGRYLVEGAREGTDGNPETERLALADVQRVADEITRVRGELDKLLPRLVDAVPELRELVRPAPPGMTGPARA